MTLRTMAELIQPRPGYFVEFWCHHMSEQGVPGTGILGRFLRGLFWSSDLADRYSLAEVTYWIPSRGPVY